MNDSATVPPATAHQGMLTRVLGGTSTTLKNLSLRRWGTGIAVLGLGVSGAFGGLDKVDPRQPPATAVNVTVDGGPWQVTVKRAQLNTDVPPLRLADKANHWLIVVVNIEITADRSVTTLSEIVTMSETAGVKKAKADEIVLLRENNSVRINRLHPGMPEEVAYFFERTGTAPLADVTVHIAGRTWRPDSLQGSSAPNEWKQDPEPRARVTVTVADKRTAPKP